MGQSDGIDPSRLRLSDDMLLELSQRPATPRLRRRRTEPFLMGPISWTWLVRAAGLPGKALAIGLVAWREAGCRKSRTVPVNLAASAAAMGIHPATPARGLRALERAGLVTVIRRPGRRVVVTLRDVIPAETVDPN